MHRKALFLTQFVFLMLSAPATGQTMQEEIAGAIYAELEQSGAPSLQVTIGHKGKIIFEDAFGLADVENDVVATSVYRVYVATASRFCLRFMSARSSSELACSSSLS